MSEGGDWANCAQLEAVAAAAECWVDASKRCMDVALSGDVAAIERAHVARGPAVDALWKAVAALREARSAALDRPPSTKSDELDGARERTKDWPNGWSFVTRDHPPVALISDALDLLRSRVGPEATAELEISVRALSVILPAASRPLDDAARRLAEAYLAVADWLKAGAPGGHCDAMYECNAAEAAYRAAREGGAG